MSAWTNDPPTEPGYYWFRVIDGAAYTMLRVDEDPEGHLSVAVFGRAYTVELQEYHGEWQGPIFAKE